MDDDRRPDEGTEQAEAVSAEDQQQVREDLFDRFIQASADAENAPPPAKTKWWRRG